MSLPTRINIGAGDTTIPGFEPWDIKQGRKAAPLDLPDACLEEIRASHVLEHFSHKSVAGVVAEWVRCLKPGGRLRVAVPDFQWVCEQYMAGAQVPIQAYVMGSQVDEDDHHGAIFDETLLIDLLRSAGLVGITHWESEIEDCAALPGVSLNLQAYKPPAEWPTTVGVMSAPRLGFMDNFFSAMAALNPMRIPLQRFFGAYWEQGIERVITGAIEQHRPEWILTLDYDSVFTLNDVQSLLMAAVNHPEADAIAALQVHRREPRPLMTMEHQPEDNVVRLERAQLRQELLKIGTAHFGLTLLKVSKLNGLERPWFRSVPDENNQWGERKIDADIAFWKGWQAAGNSLYLANRVPIGHLEMMIRWPGREMRPILQEPGEFWESGAPEGIWR